VNCNIGNVAERRAADLAMQMSPLPPAFLTSQSVMRTAPQVSSCSRPRRSGSVRLAPSKTRPVSVMWSATVAETSDWPCARTRLVAPRAPTM
jgi:hypothetical protein